MPEVARPEEMEAPDPLYVYEPSDLNEFSIDDVSKIWEGRRHLCGSLEAAAEVLALLRAASGADQHYRGWRTYLRHALVRELEEDLPSLQVGSGNVALPEGAQEGEPEANEDLLVDRREVAERNVRLRRGQSRFRDEVLAFHGGRCCVTACSEAVLLEAAHVVPYRGAHSNDVRNGLALRIDIHRLFDRFLISIDPQNLVLRVSQSLSDPFYRSLDGRRVLRASNVPHRHLLSQHFTVFRGAAA
jgi:hypothetical protein